MKKLLLVSLILITHLSLAQQGQIKGYVNSAIGAVPFAKVKLEGTTYGALADSNGYYQLDKVPYGNYILTVTSVGFNDFSTSIDINQPIVNFPINLVDDLNLNAVVVTGTMRETSISKSPVKIELINQSFFRSNPVNSVIEALQTINGVQEQINCGVCATNDIHINGMEGPYTLVLIDGMPLVSGLSSVYGFNGIPTSMIKQVEIIKGPSSTLYGTEAVGGVINIITVNPDDMPLMNIEVNGNTHQELKGALTIAPRVGKRVYTSISGDYYYNAFRMDFNEDGFTDIPLNNRISIFNKWRVLDNAGQEQFELGLRYYNEDRFGGVLDWTKDDRGSDSVYGESIFTKRYELLGTYHLPFKKINLKLDFSANRHIQDSWYGNVSYGAIQQVFFSNLIWTQDLGKRHNLITGITNRYQTYEDNTPSFTDERLYIPGVFVQDEFMATDELTLLGGVRVDHHKNHGLIVSPRLSVKKDFGSYTAFRLNYGTGFRQVHLFTEDHAFVSGSRDVLILEDLQPERSHNLTFNFNHTYTQAGFGNFDVDLFYTYFSNKIIPDFDTDPDLIIYENLDGYGITRGASVSINHQFKIPLRMRLGATYMDVFEMSEDSLGNDTRVDQVFAPKIHGVFDLAYQWKKLGLSFNYNGRVMGPQRLPEFGEEYDLPSRSPWYTIQNVQITKTFKSSPLELYLGVKNLFNYTQPSPLIDPGNPYGDNFDTSYAYGPLQVRRFMLGLRWSIDRKTQN